MRYALPQPFRDLEHTADMGVEVDGATEDEALARLVLAEASLLAGGGAVEPRRDERVAVPAGPRATMAVGLLRELLFRFATEHVLAAWCEVLSFDEAGGAAVRVGLGPFDPERHAEGLDLKAVTWHAARFERQDERWRARVVFDI